ncbi:MAG: SprT-like domain-containing protein [Bernardetiaceae bacterium]|nr:SprT-like domain-containing protein [Bernardetiaceae bacterium]
MAKPAARFILVGQEAPFTFMTEQHITKVLEKYLPPAAVPQVVAWVVHHQVHLKITRRRRSLLGTYRAPFNGHGHRISINGDLNPFAFLITFTHELAHLVNWLQHGSAVAPHGPSWQAAFRQLMGPLLSLGVFPAEVQAALARYLAQPAAATCRDQALSRVLSQYDNPANGAVHLEDVAPNAWFKLEDGRVFRKGDRLRKHFRCEEHPTGRLYRINALARVLPLASA